MSLCAGLVLVALGLWAAAAGAASDSDKCAVTATLADQKLCQEIRQLRLSNDKAQGIWQHLLDLAPFLTVLVGVGGALLAWRKQASDQVRQREADRTQRETESLRRFDTTFGQITTNLAANSVELRASAAAATLAIQRPDNPAFQPAILALLSASVKFKNEQAVAEILVLSLARAVRLNAGQATDPSAERLVLWFARAQLQRIQLNDLVLKNADVDIAFADLRHANLSGSNMWRLRGFGANLERARLSRSRLGEARLNRAICRNATFHDAVLVAATLKRADLRGAEFHRAHLQSAHFERADLRGVNFTDADVNDAYFFGATFDEATLSTLVKAKNWRCAWMDEEVSENLKARSQDRAPASPSH